MFYVLRVSIKFITFYVDDGEKKKEKTWKWNIPLNKKEKKMIICFISELFAGCRRNVRI